MSNQSVFVRYGIGVAAAGISLLIRILLIPLLGDQIPYITFFPAILVSAWFGGFGPAMATTGITAAGVVYLLLPPALLVSVFGTTHVLGLFLFLAVGTVVSYLAGTWRENMVRLRESERLYRSIGETIDYGVWVCDASGRNTYTSDSFLRLVGITQEECSEFGWAKALHPDDAEQTLAAWQECVRNEQTWDREHRFRAADGTYCHILARGAPVRDSHGRIFCWAGINLDITRLRAAEEERSNLYASLLANAEELRKSNRELEQFAFAASHDLQEPLRNIRIYTQWLMRETGPVKTARAAEFANVVQTGVVRMQNLIADLLAYSRTVHGAGEATASAGSLQSAFEVARETLRGQLDDVCGVIEAEALPTVRCDESHLVQVFQNLLGNAIKYRSPERPLRIRVSADITEDMCTVSVRDNGIGFRPEYSEYIFGLFRRLHRDAYPGTGLGLAICKRVIEGSGGRIWAVSEPEEGASFHFALPLAAAAENADAGTPATRM